MKKVLSPWGLGKQCNQDRTATLQVLIWVSITCNSITIWTLELLQETCLYALPECSAIVEIEILKVASLAMILS